MKPCLWLSFALLLSGCGGPAAEPGTLEIGVLAKRPAGLPVLGDGGWLPEALAELYSDGGFNLELQDGRFERVPALFEKSYARWGSSYHVRLVRGASFGATPDQPEREVRAEDVVFTYATLRRRELGAKPLVNAYLQSVQPSDLAGWDLRFAFSEDPGKEAFVEVASAKIVPRPPEGMRTSAWLERLERHPAGTGPYRVVSFGETLLLEAREGRPGAPQPRHRRVRIRFSEIPGSLEQDFLAGRLAAYVGARAPDLFELPGGRSSLRAQGAAGAGHYALALNTASGPLASPAARQAVLSKLEPEALIRTVVPDPRASVSYGPWPQRYLTDVLGMRPAKVEALASRPQGRTAFEAGLELIWQERPEDKRLQGLLARRLAEQLEGASQGRIRIVRQHGLDPGSFRLRLQQKRFDLCLARLELEDLPQVLGSGPAEQNYTGLQDPALDALVRRWPRAEDLDERRAIVRALTRRLGQAAAWCWLFTPVYRTYFDESRLRLAPGGILEMMQAAETW